MGIKDGEHKAHYGDTRPARQCFMPPRPVANGIPCRRRRRRRRVYVDGDRKDQSPPSWRPCILARLRGRNAHPKTHPKRRVPDCRRPLMLALPCSLAEKRADVGRELARHPWEQGCVPAGGLKAKTMQGKWHDGTFVPPRTTHEGRMGRIYSFI